MSLSRNKKLVIFDFDGVIVDSFSTSFSVAQQLDSVVSIEDFRAVLDGNIYDYYKTVPDIDISVRRQAWFEIYGPLVLQLSPINGMVELVTDLAKQHILTIVSSTSSDIISLFLEKHKFRSSFEDILGSNDHHSKVYKINHIMNKFSVAPQSALMVTDTLGDMREASTAQIRSIGVSWGYHEPERLRKGEPLAIVDTPKALKDAINSYLNGY